MDPSHTLSLVGPLDLRLPTARPVPLSPRARLLIAGLVLNAGFAVGAGAAALSLRTQLDTLTQHARLNAQATERYAQDVAMLGRESRAVADGLDDMRAAVAHHARQESLFFKALILRPGLNHALARRIAAAVETESQAAGQDPNLVLAIIAVESDFNPRAVSPAGAVGLMQVMPLWKPVFGPADLREPEASIHAGVQILGQYQELYGDLALAVTAYNRGPGQVNDALAAGENPANGYSARVFEVRQRLEAIDRSARP
jgi:soluble lytic murein transglycosylase-like protein